MASITKGEMIRVAREREATRKSIAQENSGKYCVVKFNPLSSNATLEYAFDERDAAVTAARDMNDLNKELKLTEGRTADQVELYCVRRWDGHKLEVIEVYPIDYVLSVLRKC